MGDSNSSISGQETTTISNKSIGKSLTDVFSPQGYIAMNVSSSESEDENTENNFEVKEETSSSSESDNNNGSKSTKKSLLSSSDSDATTCTSNVSSNKAISPRRLL